MYDEPELISLVPDSSPLSGAMVQLHVRGLGPNVSLDTCVVRVSRWKRYLSEVVCVAMCLSSRDCSRSERERSAVGDTGSARTALLRSTTSGHLERSTERRLRASHSTVGDMTRVKCQQRNGVSRLSSVE